MATTTPNFGWPVPTSTDLVKDGATAIEALGDGIDTSLVDLKGGTTGQVLSKASGTDMDFAWVAQDDSNAIQNAIVDAKGDLIAATAADTPARLAVGGNDLVLTADSTTATGLKYSSDWTSYTPTWNSYSGAAPSLGNGTITAQWLQVGKVVTVQIRLIGGSTTTWGGGGWYFSLPKNAKVFNSQPTGAMGSGYAEDAGVSGYVIPHIRIGGAADRFEIFTTGWGLYQYNSPFTWANGDFFQIQFSYGVA
jgi:hypothetical protein